MGSNDGSEIAEDLPDDGKLERLTVNRTPSLGYLLDGLRGSSTSVWNSDRGTVDQVGRPYGSDVAGSPEIQITEATWKCRFSGTPGKRPKCRLEDYSSGT